MPERHDELTDQGQAVDEELLDVDEDGEDGEDDELGPEPITETHPGFTITCDECGSPLVVVENDLEFLPNLGRQGNVYLRCTECDAETFLLPQSDEDLEVEDDDEE